MEGCILRKEKHMVSFCLLACRVLGPASAASFRKLVFKTYHEKGACWDLSCCWHSLIVTSYHVHLTLRMGGCHISRQPLPFWTALTALIQLFLALALSKVHIKVSVSSSSTVVLSCCQSSGCLGNNLVLLSRAWTWSWFLIWLLLLKIKLCLFLPLVCISLH